MAATRKLQTEIQQCLKKVDEGVEEFNDIWEKVYTADTQSLKEKFEADLKKEIKKLQRLRDQIKTWISSSEIKDKTQLVEARKTIESKMEQFKVCERDTKTKAYSKEGLARDARMDPKEALREEKRNWLNDCLDRLQDLNNTVEADKEKLSSGKNKSKNKEELSRLENRLQKQKWHMAKIELIIKLIDNDELDPTLIDSIKDSVEYYLETASDDDGALGVEHEFDIYEDLDLDSYNVAPVTVDVGSRHAKDDEDNANTATATPPAAPVSTPPVVNSGGSATVAVTSNTTTIIEHKSQPAKPSEKAAGDKVEKAPLAQIVKGGAKAVAASTTSAAATPTPTADSKGELTPPPGIAKANAAAKDDSADSKKNDSPRLGSKAETKPLGPAPTPNMTKVPVPVATMLKGPSPAPTIAATTTVPPAASEKPVPAPGLTPSVLATSSTSASPASTAMAGVTPTAPPALTAAISSTPVTAPPLVPVTPSTANAAATVASAAVSPLAMLTPEQQQALLMLKQSASLMPEEFQYIPRHSNPTSHPLFPSTPICTNNAEYSALFEKLPLDTMFFAFYFQQNTFQQTLAAKRLKKNSWRFHKKYVTWFQRHSEPKIATQDFEEGTYLYFDYDGGWSQRIKADFKFEYGFLEDELN
jgi:CCR4-NOT transcription complex subunit 3